MKLLVAVLLFCTVEAVEKPGKICEGVRNERIKGFNGQPLDIPVPCKYWALKDQKCGEYKITLSPGNKWLGFKYRLDTLWLGVKSINSSDEWNGRTTNKIAVKFINAKAKGQNRNLFNQKGGSMTTSKHFNQDIDPKEGPYMEDTGGNFRIYINPWHPNKTEKQYQQSTFKFICNKDMEPYVPYPRQMCGNSTTKAVETRGKQFLNLKKSAPELTKRLTIYYDLFMNEDVSQMEDRCLTAVNILATNCSRDHDRVLTALKHCEQIIGDSGENGRTACVTKYSCHPMDIMNACLRWGCAGRGFEKGKTYEDLCLATAEATDLCRSFDTVHGNLTELIKEANCFKDFLPIEKEKKKKSTNNKNKKEE